MVVLAQQSLARSAEYSTRLGDLGLEKKMRRQKDVMVRLHLAGLRFSSCGINGGHVHPARVVRVAPQVELVGRHDEVVFGTQEGAPDPKIMGEDLADE